jgi:hypothetical protein
MTSYYPSPSTPFSGAGRNTPPDFQRPASVLMEKMNSYPPDVYAGAPPTSPPLQPRPAPPARILGWPYSPSPESPALIGRSAPGVPIPQAPDSPAPIQRTFKTFLQWKAEAQAITADYQHNGYHSPIAWVFRSVFFPSRETYVSFRYM